MNARAFVFAIAGLVACLAAGPAVGQVRWEVGFKGGLGVTNLTGDTDISESVQLGPDTFTLSGSIGDARSGFAGGGFVAARFSDALGVRLEALYEQKGGKGQVQFAVNGVPSGSTDVTYKLDYIEVPILAVGSFAAGSAARVDVFGGPAIAFMLGAKLRGESGGLNQEDDIGDTTKDTDIGFAAGAGLTYAVSPAVNVVFDGRYTFGFSEVFNSRENIGNGALSIMTGISLPIGAP